MTLPSEHQALLKAARKSYRSIRREMKTLKALLDALSGVKEPEDADEAAPDGNGAHVETGVAAQHDPMAHADPQNPNVL